MDKYCIYLRKSRADADAEARGEGETLARHEAALLELARRQHLLVAQVYREVISGESIAARPIMQKLLAEVGQGVWAGVLVIEVERLARGDTMDQGLVAQTFKYSNTRILTPVKSYDPNNEYDEEYFEFGLFMSRREYKVINRRLQRGRLASVREGKFVGNRAPYGYERRKLDKEKGFTLMPVPEQAEVIRMIFELYTRGDKRDNGEYRRLGAGLIARRLNTLRILSPSGLEWTSPTIRDILSNPVYIGKIRWNWRPATKQIVGGNLTVVRPRSAPGECIILDGLHDAILDAGVFKEAQERMRSNPASPIGDRQTVKNPLAGLVVCGKCNRHMVRRPYAGDYPDMLMCPAPACGNVSSQLSYVERRILESLADWLSQYTLQWDHSAVQLSNTIIAMQRKAQKKAEDEIETLKKQRSHLHDLLEQGVYDTCTFRDRWSEIHMRLCQAEEELRVLADALRSEEHGHEPRRTVIPKVDKIWVTYKTMSTSKAKNDLLKSVLKKVVYVKEHSGRWHYAPDSFELTVYPQIPESHG